MDNFLHYIRQFIHLPRAAWEEAKSLACELHLRKGSFFYQQGKICNHVAFINKGILRSFYLIEGEELTRFVSLQNSIITAFASFVQQIPSQENIQAISDCHLFTLETKDLSYLYDKYPSWEKLGRLILEHHHLRMEKRMLSLLAFTAEQRYKALCREQPDIVQKVPLQYIASILGVKPETLSRIRKKMSSPIY